MFETLDQKQYIEYPSGVFDSEKYNNKNSVKELNTIKDHTHNPLNSLEKTEFSNNGDSVDNMQNNIINESYNTYTSLPAPPIEVDEAYLYNIIPKKHIYSNELNNINLFYKLKNEEVDQQKLYPSNENKHDHNYDINTSLKYTNQSTETIYGFKFEDIKKNKKLLAKIAKIDKLQDDLDQKYKLLKDIQQKPLFLDRDNAIVLFKLYNYFNDIDTYEFDKEHKDIALDGKKIIDSIIEKCSHDKNFSKVKELFLELRFNINDAKTIIKHNNNNMDPNTIRTRDYLFKYFKRIIENGTLFLFNFYYDDVLEIYDELFKICNTKIRKDGYITINQ